MKSSLTGHAMAAVAVWILLLVVPATGDAAFLYKNYIVKYDKGWDVLCDPYVVQPNDWVIKLFKQKGEISHEDFPEFLHIFRRINPHITDINRIRPGQQILIPLRKMPLGTLPGQDSGKVTIPFVTIHSMETAPPARAGTYRVRRGDTVSELISARFGRFGSEAYLRGIRLFQELNPHIQNLDLIFAGSDIRLPSPEQIADEKTVRTGFSLPERERIDGDSFVSILLELAHALGGRLMHKGIYYFPTQQGFDVPLDLVRTPVMETPGGIHLVFADAAEAKSISWDLLRQYWENARHVEVGRSSTPQEVVSRVMASLPQEWHLERLSFSDKGISVEVRGQWLLQMAESDITPVRQVCVTLIESPAKRTSPAIQRYLEQRDIFVADFPVEAQKPADPNPEKDSPAPNRSSSAAWVEKGDIQKMIFEVLSAIGYPVKQKVKVSFPYAGVQIEAISNLVSTEAGNPVFIDFGNLYGEAEQAIRKSGFAIIQLKEAGSDLRRALPLLLKGLGYESGPTPIFEAAERPAHRCTTLTIPGILARKTDETDEGSRNRVFFSFVPLNGNIVYFLQEKDIRVVFVADAVKKG
ncbi:MAG: LysM peptidoglycan-binding domain-containing protein [Desulfobacteraceae bacterium]|nr:LysM peptidoglycan-binding domain-containing protein [Desulfobacteraceae bacterium]